VAATGAIGIRLVPQLIDRGHQVIGTSRSPERAERCMDAARWYVMTKKPGDMARLDALPQYQTSPLFTDAQRAALDYATELTQDKKVKPGTFVRLTATTTRARSATSSGWWPASTSTT
jgi:uncharacterized protein YbjT (DUF2867 family)